MSWPMRCLVFWRLPRALLSYCRWLISCSWQNSNVNQLITRSDMILITEFIALRRGLQDNPDNHPDHTFTNDLILQNGLIWLPSNLNFISLLLQEFHTTPTGGHMGITKTLTRLQENFTWSSIRNDVRRFVVPRLPTHQI